ncbi:MAG: serine/threonine protein kinase [Planctomycetales bacterium]|nr:serine/threonine protein kinase [Planctomycetales bacterium]
MNRSPSPHCPEQQTLRNFVHGEISDSQILQIVSHLEECDACGDTVRAFNGSDTLLSLVKAGKTSSKPNTSEQDQSAVLNLMQKLHEVDLLEHPSSPTDRLAEYKDRIDEVLRKVLPPEAENELGRLAHYRLLRLLGVGAMGVVFLAQDDRLQRDVALKILRPSLGESARQRFLLEARSAAAIDHDHIVTIYEVGQVDSLAYISMQFLEGETLEARLQRDNTIPTNEAIEIGCQIAEGLAAAHAKSLIHRDIKPANIWLEAHRQRAKILDFGLARAINDNPDLTETGMIAGTPAFMSPEQASGQTVDDRSDLFSLGAVLYRMATGKLPFHAANTLAMLKAIQNQQPTDPTQINPSIPNRHADTIMWLLQPDANQRPQSALLAKAALKSETAVPGRHAVNSNQTRHSVRGKSIRKIAAIVAFIGLGWGGIEFAPQIIRIVTDKGVIAIESPDPNVTIEFLANTDKENIKPKHTLKLSESNELEIRSGDYTVRISDGSPDLAVKDKRVQVVRGGTSRVVIQEKDGTVAANGTSSVNHADRQTQDDSTSDSNQPQDAVMLKIFGLVNAEAQSLLPTIERLFAGKTAKQELSLSVDQRTNSMLAEGTIADLQVLEAVLLKLDSEPDAVSTTNPTASTERSAVYGGKTSAEWLYVLRFDRQPEQICEALRALRVLGINESNRQVFFESLLGVIRIHGLTQADVPSIVMARGNHIKEINVLARVTIRSLGASATVDFLMQCLESHTMGSISFPMFLVSVWNPGETLEDSLMIIDRTELAAELNRRFTSVTLPLAVDVQHDDHAHRTQAWATLAHLYELADPSLDQMESDTPWERHFMPLLEQALVSKDSTIASFCALDMIYQFDPKHPGLLDAAQQFPIDESSMTYPFHSADYGVSSWFVDATILYEATFPILANDAVSANRCLIQIQERLEPIRVALALSADQRVHLSRSLVRRLENMLAVINGATDNRRSLLPTLELLVEANLPDATIKAIQETIANVQNDPESSVGDATEDKSE